MKKNVIYFFTFLTFFLSGCASRCNNNQPTELINISGLKAGPAYSHVNPLRLQALQDTAVTIGAQGGLAWRAQQIICTLKREEQNLDRIYNFRAMLLDDDILPPVLEEGQNELAVDGCNTIRAADRIFRIVCPPCFVTAPPTWRDYLSTRFPQPEQPDVTLLPKNRDEAAIWNCYVQAGWQQGIDQANQIFTANLNRLKRDYNGMILYRVLLAQNMVTPPYVAKTDLGVTGDANELRVNDRVLRIAATSQLNTNPDTWKPIIAHPNACQTCPPPVVEKAPAPKPAPKKAVKKPRKKAICP